MSGSGASLRHLSCAPLSTVVNTPAAFDLDALYRTHGASVHRRGLRLLKDETQAWDAVQETFLRARKYQAGFRGGSALAWLLTIADRVCFDRLRQRKRDARWHDTSALDATLLVGARSTDLGAVDDKRAQRAWVTQLLADVDERTALIVMRRYFDALGLDAIASELRINERTVRRSLDKFMTTARARGFHGATDENFVDAGGAHA